jgi:hypothetical protein
LVGKIITTYQFTSSLLVNHAIFTFQTSQEIKTRICGINRKDAELNHGLAYLDFEFFTSTTAIVHGSLLYDILSCILSTI